MRGILVVLCVGTAGCEVLFPPANGHDAPAVEPADAAFDAEVADAGAPDAMLGAFTSGQRIAITPAPADGSYDTDLSLTLDESQLAFGRYSTTVSDSGDIYLAQRAGTPVDWVGATATSFSLAGRTEGNPKLSPGGTAIWISAYAITQSADIEAYRRASPSTVIWTNTSANDAAGLNTVMDDRPSTPTTGLDRTIVVRGGKLFEYVRPSGAGAWQAVPATLDEVNNLGTVGNPQLSADGTVLAFVFVVGSVHNDIYIATRPTPDAGFGTPAPAPGINTPANEADPWLSADRRRLWFSRNGAALPFAMWGIYYAER